MIRKIFFNTILAGLGLLFFVTKGISAQDTVKEIKPKIPKVDFSYAFGTPHRITVGRPTDTERTLLDLRPGSLHMIWNYKNLTDLALSAYMVPKDNSVTWDIEVVPDIDGKPFATSRWTRMDGYIPSLDNTYNDARGSIRIEAVGGTTATLARIQVENTDSLPHQYRVLCMNNTESRSNRAWVDPDRWQADVLFTFARERADRVALLGVGADRWVTSDDGRPTNSRTLSFVWDLKPGEKRTAWIVRPYYGYAADLTILRRHDWASEFETGKQEWRDLVARMKKVTIPDADIMDVLRACFSDLFIMREPLADGYVGVLCGTQIYRQTNPTEPSIASIAFGQFGLHDEAEESQRVHTENQGMDGDWADPRGWSNLGWLVSGFKAWAIMEHYYLTGDLDYLAKVYPHMLASSRYQESQRARTRILKNGERTLSYGLMPRGQGDCGMDNDGEWFGVFIPHNIWTVYADKLSAEAAKILGKTVERNELEQIFKTAYADLMQIIEKGAIREKEYKWIPGIAGKTNGSRFGVLNALFPCHLLSSDHELITGTLHHMEQNMSAGGVPLHTGFMEKGSWVAMTLDNIAETYLARGNGDKAAHYLYTTLNHGTPLYSWCEERGEEPGTTETAGDLQHLWTPVAVVRIIRDMLVMEDDSVLNLALGTDRSWLASGKPLGIVDMPTHFGNVTYQMQYDSKEQTVSGEIHVSHRPNQAACKWITLHIRLPEGLKVKSVDKNSKAAVLSNGEGIRWKGALNNMKFKVAVSK